MEAAGALALALTDLVGLDVEVEVEVEVGVEGVAGMQLTGLWGSTCTLGSGNSHCVLFVVRLT